MDRGRQGFLEGGRAATEVEGHDTVTNSEQCVAAARLEDAVLERLVDEGGVGEDQRELVGHLRRHLTSLCAGTPRVDGLPPTVKTPLQGNVMRAATDDLTALEAGYLASACIEAARHKEMLPTRVLADIALVFDPEASLVSVRGAQGAGRGRGALA